MHCDVEQCPPWTAKRRQFERSRTVSWFRAVFPSLTENRPDLSGILNTSVARVVIPVWPPQGRRQAPRTESGSLLPIALVAYLRNRQGNNIKDDEDGSALTTDRDLGICRVLMETSCHAHDSGPLLLNSQTASNGRSRSSILL